MQPVRLVLVEDVPTEAEIAVRQLEAGGFAVDIAPVHPKMGALVKAASENASSIVAKKRMDRATLPV